MPPFDLWVCHRSTSFYRPVVSRYNESTVAWLCEGMFTLQMYFHLLDSSLEYGADTLKIARTRSQYEWRDVCSAMGEAQGRHATLIARKDTETGERAPIYYILDIGEDFLCGEVNADLSAPQHQSPQIQPRAIDAQGLAPGERWACGTIVGSCYNNYLQRSTFATRRVISALRGIGILQITWHVEVTNARLSWQKESRRLLQGLGYPRQIGGSAPGLLTGFSVYPTWAPLDPPVTSSSTGFHE